MSTYILHGVTFTRYLDSLYFVSEAGIVFSLYRNKVIKPNYKNGYGWFSIRIGKSVVKKSIHRLIAEVYIPNPNNHPLVRHLNDDKSDNRICNLAWGTKADNMNDAVKNNKLANRPSPQGEKHRKAKFTKETVLAIRKDYSLGIDYKKICAKYNISDSHMYNIATGKRWSHI